MNDVYARVTDWRYVGIAAVTLIAVSFVYWYFCWGAPTTILLVRHADRQGSADALSPVGVVRAQDLVHVVEKSGISAIYTSEAARTQDTAAPAAGALGITPVPISAGDVAGLVNDIRTHHSGQNVLVVGHSNTVPQVIAAFSGGVINIGETEYDNLYVLTICRCHWKSPRVMNLQYGAASP